jgi:hypothetical protein
VTYSQTDVLELFAEAQSLGPNASHDPALALGLELSTTRVRARHAPPTRRQLERAALLALARLMP